MRQPGKTRRRAALLLAVLAAAIGAVRADDEFDFRLIRPIVTLSTWGTPNAELQDNGGDFSASTVSLGANIPLGPTHIHPGGKVLGHQFLLGATVSTTSQTIDALPSNPRLYAGVLTFSALFASSAGNLYLGSLGASFAEDEDTIDDLDTRLFALGLGSWRKNDELMFIYGAALTYVYARQMLLPAFGVVWRPNPTWAVTGTLPFYVRVSQKLRPELQMNYLLYATGQRYRFANDGLFPGQDAVVYERVGENHLGAEIEYRPTADLTLLGQAGVANGRRLSFANLDEDDFVDDTIDPALYVKLTLRYAFGKSLMEEIEARAGKAVPGAAP
jgi:hypothetical protein